MAKFEAGMESMVDTYIFETTSLLEELDQILMKTESEHSFSPEEINEIFRTMHTIKGSSAMMGLDNMSKLAHSIEDMFYVILRYAKFDNPQINTFWLNTKSWFAPFSMDNTEKVIGTGATKSFENAAFFIKPGRILILFAFFADIGAHRRRHAVHSRRFRFRRSGCCP